jgi:hypothetical protein
MCSAAERVWPRGEKTAKFREKWVKKWAKNGQNGAHAPLHPHHMPSAPFIILSISYFMDILSVI